MKDHDNDEGAGAFLVWVEAERAGAGKEEAWGVLINIYKYPEGVRQGTR